MEKEQLIDHPNAVSSWQVMRVTRDRGLLAVVVVATDLVFDPEHEDYDKKAVDSLVAAVNKYLDGAKNVEEVELVPVEGDYDDDEDDDD